MLGAHTTRGLVCLVAWAAMSCSTSAPVMLVELHTNMQPGLEFDLVESVLYPEADTLSALDLPVAPPVRTPLRMEQSPTGGVRVATFEDVGRGAWTVEVRLSLGTERVAVQRAAAHMGDVSTVVDVVIERDCRGVECPNSSQPGSLACIGGMCVAPRCASGPAEGCPPRECTDHAECSSEGFECGAGLCLRGYCGVRLAPERCSAGEMCLPEGCRAPPDAGVSRDAALPDAAPADGGPPDGGPTDAGDAGPSLAGVVEVAAGESHTCARLESGHVYCWGSNNHGRLGVGLTPDSSAVPLRVAGLDDAVELVANNDHSCARRMGGQVVCWGRNVNGRLGDGTTDDRDSPTPVDTAMGMVQLGAGRFHTCGVRTDGMAVCWGGNNDGQLGDGTTDDRTRPTVVRDLNEATQVAGGSFHACALRSGTVRCWGDNGQGQLGLADMVNRLTPTTPVLGLADVDEVASAGPHTCARRVAGQVFCWGNNRLGELGDGTQTHSPTAVRVLGLDNTVGLAVSMNHSCAWNAEGRLWCWGNNDFGQLSLAGATSLATSPVEATGVSNVVDVATGLEHTCAVTADGSLWCWGRNLHGQLGDGTRIDRAMPRRVLAMR